MLKDNIVRTAIRLYVREGIRGVNMDRVADALHISKKTIYKLFGNKEQLLEECFRREVMRMARIIQNVQFEAQSSIEAIVRTCMCLFGSYSYVCPSFRRDVVSFPLINMFWEKCQSELERQCEINFISGVDEGDFLPGQNYKLIAAILIEQVWQLKPPFHMLVISTTLRGVCTPQGVEKLSQLISEVKYQS